MLSDALLKAVFDQSTLPFALIDAEGRLASWNPAFGSLFRGLAGVEPGEVAASFFDLIAEREGARLGAAAADILIRASPSAAFESPFRGADGSLRWLRLEFSRVEAPQAAQAPPGGRDKPYLLCAPSEITEMVLRERGLQDARDEAEKATHTKSQFLANMSHEIRTPIQTILGVVELLRETELDGEQSDYVHQVRFSADVLLGLINDILDFSKIEAGKLELAASRFDLRTVVYQSVELLTMEANRKGLEIVVDIDEGLPELARGDPGRLRQVIVNLLKNAVKFTREGGISLMIARASSPAGPRLRFEVADSGPGIPEATRARLFTPFFQGELAQERRAGGTGLGLAICRHLVELMDGAIGVLPSESVTGSVFWFELPLGDPEGPPPPSREGSGAARLLVVDDFPLAGSFAARAAASAGYRVSLAESGEEALASLREAAAGGDAFSLCLIDQNMPRMDGWRLASEITGDTAINGARLILMAPVGAINADAKMRLLRWFNGYIAKPVKPGELLDVLARALSSEVDLESAEAEGPAAPKAKESRFRGDILLAEDHEVNRELFTLLLGKMGCAVVAAQDGSEAVRIGSSRGFDLVLMDIFMPIMTGYEASRALRDGGYAGPIVAITASALKGEREKCIEAGMNDVLLKPFKKEELAAILSEYLPRFEGAGGAERRKEARGGGNPVFDSSVFDWAAVLDTFLGQGETVSGLLKRFIAKASAQMGELGEALAAGDAARIMEISHSIKGASWNLSARRLGEAALAGETAGREGDLAAAALALEAMRSAFADFSEAAAPHAET